MRYEWDEAKNRQNQQKHEGISFELAALVFEDERCLLGLDRIDETGEQRWHAIGAARIGPTASLLLVVHAYRGGLAWRRNHPHYLSSQSGKA